jgi:hypothetical protein
MRIIHTDNFGGDYPDEKFVTEIPVIPDTEEGRDIGWTICRALQKLAGGELAQRYYRLVDNDYKLQLGFEP